MEGSPGTHTHKAPPRGCGRAATSTATCAELGGHLSPCEHGEAAITFLLPRKATENT